MMSSLNTIFTTTLALLFLTMPLQAKNKTETNAMPVGFDWQASVLDIQYKPYPILLVRLTEKKDGCFMWQSVGGTVGDTIAVPIDPTTIAAYQIGQNIHVWIGYNAAIMVHPPCPHSKDVK